MNPVQCWTELKSLKVWFTWEMGMISSFIDGQVQLFEFGSDVG